MNDGDLKTGERKVRVIDDASTEHISINEVEVMVQPRQGP